MRHQEIHWLQIREVREREEGNFFYIGEYRTVNQSTSSKIITRGFAGPAPVP